MKEERAAYGAGAVVGTAGAIAALNAWNPVGWAAGIVAMIGATITFIAAQNTEDAKKLRALEKVQKDLEKQRKEYIDNIRKSDILLGAESDEGVLKALEVKQNIVDSMGSLNNEVSSYLSQIDEFTNLSGMLLDERIDYAEQIQKMMSGMQGMTDNVEMYTYMAKFYEENIANVPEDEISSMIKEQMKRIVEKAYSMLAKSSGMSFTQLGEYLDQTGEKLRNITAIVKDFNKNGSISLDTYKDLAGALDGIDFSKLGQLPDGSAQIKKATDAILNLNLAYDANTGMITMNGKALKALQEIQEAQTKAELLNKINELKATKATWETELAYYDAQIKATSTMLEVLEGTTDGKIKLSELESKAQRVVESEMATSISNITSNYQADANNNSKWKSIVIGNLAEMSNAWNTYYTAVKNGASDSEIKQLYDKAVSVTYKN